MALYANALSPARILAHYQAGTNAAPVTPYTAVVAADNPVEYLRLGEAAFPARKAENLGTLGPTEDGVYAPANKTVGGDVGMTLGAIGPRPPTFPGLESTNIGVLTTNGSVDLAALNLNTNTVTPVCICSPTANYGTTGMAATTTGVRAWSCLKASGRLRRWSSNRRKRPFIWTTAPDWSPRCTRRTTLVCPFQTRCEWARTRRERVTFPANSTRWPFTGARCR